MRKKHSRFTKFIAVFIIALLVSVSAGFTVTPANANAAGTTVKKTDLVLVRDYNSEILIDMRYATYENFVGKTLYPSATCVLAKGTLDKLIKANNLLKKQGYRIKIWDAYRPLSVQKIMWEATPDKKYVANPYGSTGSNHNRGTAVDITMVDKNGKEVDMPTGFDNFTTKASPSYKGMSAAQRKNLDILTKAMTSSGFKTISTEWWHFDDTEWKSYKIQDLPLSKFDKTNYVLDSKTISGLKSVKANSPSQLVVVTSQLANSSYAMINTYEKGKTGWVSVLRNIPCCIGLKGFSADKTEGDEKTPAGAFHIGTCFSKTAGIATGLDFCRYDSKDVWVDDPASKYYNTHQREPANGRWASAENFSKVKNGIYDVFFNIEYNTAQEKGKGSAIFFHIVDGTKPTKYTNGCIATDKSSLLKIVKWLDKDTKPMILQGTLADVVTY